MEGKRIMTVDELTKYLHVSRITAYTLAGRADFPSFRVGRRILIDAQGLDAWIANGGTWQKEGATVGR